MEKERLRNGESFAMRSSKRLFELRSEMRSRSLILCFQKQIRNIWRAYDATSLNISIGRWCPLFLKSGSYFHFVLIFARFELPLRHF